MEWLALLQVWVPLAIGWFIVHRLSAARLKINLQDMSIRVQQLIDNADEPSKIHLCSVAIAEFRQSVTERHFESEHIHALDMSSLQMAEIADAYLHLKRALFSLKLSQFPKRRGGFARA